MPPPLGTPADLDAAIVESVSSEVPGFGGAFVGDDGALHVWLTKPSALEGERAARALGRDLFDVGGRRVVPERAKFTFAALERWQNTALRDVFAEPGVAFTDVDEARNRLLVVGRDPAALRDAVDRIAAKHGVPRDAILVEQGEPIRHALADRVRPVVGGTQIQFQTGFLGLGTGTCTMGFTAVRNGVDGFVTNSHCSRTRGEVDNGRYWQPTRPFSEGDQVGTEIVDPAFFTGGQCPVNRRCRFSDASFIDAATGISLGRVARPPAGNNVWNGTDTFRVTSEAGTFVGDFAQKVGRTTGRTIGQVTHFCVEAPVNGEDITMLCQHAVQAAVDPGDSGSPVITSPAAGTDVGLLGVLWGEGTVNGVEVFVYSGINGTQTELGDMTTCAAGFTC